MYENDSDLALRSVFVTVVKTGRVIHSENPQIFSGDQKNVRLERLIQENP